VGRPATLRRGVPRADAVRWRGSVRTTSTSHLTVLRKGTGVLLGGGGLGADRAVQRSLGMVLESGGTRQTRRPSLAVMADCLAGRRRPSPPTGGGRQRALDDAPASRRGSRPLGEQKCGCSCHLGDRQPGFRPAHLHLGGGSPKVIMCRLRPPPGAAGHDHLTGFACGIGLADPRSVAGRRCLPAWADVASPGNLPTGRA